MKPIFAKCRDWPLAQVAKTVKEAGIWPYSRRIDETGDGTEVVVEGRRVIMVGSNDYLGLATDPRIKAAAVHAVEKYGSTCSGSRLANGSRDIHEELERRLATFLGREDVLIATTGYQANLAISSLLNQGDVLLADQRNHSSLIDAARLSRAERRVYRHNDMAHLAELLDDDGQSPNRLIVSDSMFSAEGDLAMLGEMVDLAKRHEAGILRDCAHDLGVLGAHGRGAPELFGVESDIDVVTFTLSKAFASLGGGIAGPRDIVDYVRNTSRPYAFSAAMSPAAAAAALAALDVVETEPQRRVRLLDITETLHNGLRALGFDTGQSVTPVAPIAIGDEFLCFRFWTELFENGVFVNAFSAPNVPLGKAFVRCHFTAAYTDAQVERILDVFASVGRRLGVIPQTPPETYEPVAIARPVMSDLEHSE